ncbi:hypothetical protein DIPPA_25003 [Diplonema papillatum]|nr:hypothetical protein DIPPA_25003 [Diplonema papillatum]|eukprot:gene3404-5325_t
MAIGADAAKQRFRGIFDSLDANKDGGIVWKELEANIGKADPEKARQLMEMADKNQDDKIEYDEFLSFVEVILRAESLTFDKLSEEHMTHFENLFKAD